MLPSGRNTSAYGKDKPRIGTTRNFGPVMMLPLGPRVLPSKTNGPSGSVSRGGDVGCCAVATAVAIRIDSAETRGNEDLFETGGTIHPPPLFFIISCRSGCSETQCGL